MSRPISVTVGNNNFTINSGYLPDETFAQFAAGGLTVVSDVLATMLGQPVAALVTDTLNASLRADSALSWTVGPIGIQFSPNVEGTVMVRTAGEVFSDTEVENDDDPAHRQVITTALDKAYVTITQRVGLQVTAA
jgi:hypothetical protein